MRFFLAVTTVIVLTASLYGDDNWSRFRGPNGTGISSAVEIPTTFGKGDFLWKAELPGAGHSSPVIWDNRIFVTFDQSANLTRRLAAFDVESGKQIWTAANEYARHSKHSQNTHASSTPAVDADHVYVLWQQKTNSRLTAFSHAGKEKWSVDLGGFKSGHGSATSPIVYRDMVIVCNDHQGIGSCLLALRTSDGSMVWKTPRKVKRTCYSTPCVFQTPQHPAELVFTHSYLGVSGIDPESGTERWNIKPFGEFQQRACASPIVANGLVFGASGFASAEKNLVAIRPPQAKSTKEPEEVYRITNGAPHVPTPLAYENRIYCWSDQGIVTAAEITTGKTLWKKRVGGNFFASPICIAGRLFNISREGEVVVLETGDEFKELGRNDIGVGGSATLAVAGNKLIIRTTNSLIAVGGKSQ